MEIRSKQGQNMMDLAVIFHGSFEMVVDLAFQNDRSITDQLATGETLVTNDTFGNRIADYYSKSIHQPATAISRTDERNLCDEVGSNTADFGTFTFHFDDSFYK